MSSNTIVFDLDDTLVPEIAYLKSAFREIAKFVDGGNELLFDEMFDWYQNKENVFTKLGDRYINAELSLLKNMYRNHFPDFESLWECRQMLANLKNDGHLLGLITDGFSVTQRNKIRALNIEDLFDQIVISEEFGSEKPHEKNYCVFHKFNTDNYMYVADNVSKDFITPNRLGWTTVCLLNQGSNIHSQDFDKDSIYLPQHKIKSLMDLNTIIKIT